MNKEQIQKEIDGMAEYLPISEIEKRIGLPKTTLQKVLSGERELPKKWHRVVEVYFGVTKKEDDRSNPLINAARGRDENGVNNDEVRVEKSVHSDRKPFMSDAIKKKLGIS